MPIWISAWSARYCRLSGGAMQPVHGTRFEQNAYRLRLTKAKHSVPAKNSASAANLQQCPATRKMFNASTGFRPGILFVVRRMKRPRGFVVRRIASHAICIVGYFERAIGWRPESILTEH